MWRVFIRAAIHADGIEQEDSSVDDGQRPTGQDNVISPVVDQEASGYNVQTHTNQSEQEILPTQMVDVNILW